MVVYCLYKLNHVGRGTYSLFQIYDSGIEARKHADALGEDEEGFKVGKVMSRSVRKKYVE